MGLLKYWFRRSIVLLLSSYTQFSGAFMGGIHTTVATTHQHHKSTKYPNLRPRIYEGTVKNPGNMKPLIMSVGWMTQGQIDFSTFLPMRESMNFVKYTFNLMFLQIPSHSPRSNKPCRQKRRKRWVARSSGMNDMRKQTETSRLTNGSAILMLWYLSSRNIFLHQGKRRRSRGYCIWALATV